MTFAEYALGLFPYCSFGKSKSVYFTELIGNFIEDAALYSCSLLKLKNDTKYRLVMNKRQITPKDAQFLYDHRDSFKFSKWMFERIYDSASYDNVMLWLDKHGISGGEPNDLCQKLLEDILLDIINGNTVPQNSQKTDNDIELIDEILKKINQLPRPKDIPVPQKIDDSERIYIEELYKAYEDAEYPNKISENNLDKYPEYKDDIDDRRIDFYAAKSIQRGLLESWGGRLSNQFDVLKNETYDGVKDTARRRHENGYERMLAVMEQAVNAPVTTYVLGTSPYWISGRIKKGVCHYLVNDKKLVWVRRKKGNG